MVNPNSGFGLVFCKSVLRDRLWAQVLWEAGKAGVLMAGAIALVAPECMAAALTNWHYDAAANQLEVVVAADITPKYFLMAQPARIVVDLPNTEMGTVKVKESYAGAVTEVRVSQFQPGVTRIVLELSPEIALTPDQVQLEQVKSEGGDRWVLRPLIVGGAAAPIPLSVTPAMQQGAMHPGEPAPPAIAETPVQSLPEGLPLETEPKRLSPPAVEVPSLDGDAATETPNRQPPQPKPSLSPVEETPAAIAEGPRDPATVPRPNREPEAQPRSPQPDAPRTPPAAPEPEPSTLVLPPKPVTSPPAIGSDVSPVTQEPSPSEILPPSVPPPAVAIAQLPPTQTTPLPPVEAASPDGSSSPGAIQIAVPPPLTLPGQPGASGVVVPTTSQPQEAPVRTTVVPVQPAAIAAPSNPVGPSSADLPATVVPVTPLGATPLQVPPPAAIAVEKSTPDLAPPAPLSMPPLTAGATRSQPPPSTVLQSPPSSLLQNPNGTPPLMLPAIPLADSPPAIANPATPPVSSVLQPPAASVMQGNASVVPPPAIANLAPSPTPLQPPRSGVMQGTATPGEPTAAIANLAPPPVADVPPAPVSSVLQGGMGQMPLTTTTTATTAAPTPPPASSVMQGNPDRVMPPVGAVMQAPMSSVMQASTLQPSGTQPGPDLPRSPVVTGSVNSLQVPPSGVTAVLPPIAPEQPAVVAVPPLELPGIPAVSPATPRSTGQSTAIGPSSQSPPPTVEFGQPLPVAGAAALTTVPRTVSNVAPSPSWGQTYYQSARPGVILPAGATIRLAYPGPQPLPLPARQAQQVVLVLQTEVRDTLGQVVFPRGSYVTGQLAEYRFTARSIAVGDRAIPFAAESALLNPGLLGPGQIIPIQMTRSVP